GVPALVSFWAARNACSSATETAVDAVPASRDQDGRSRLRAWRSRRELPGVDSGARMAPGGRLRHHLGRMGVPHTFAVPSCGELISLSPTVRLPPPTPPSGASP